MKNVLVASGCIMLICLIISIPVSLGLKNLWLMPILTITGPVWFPIFWGIPSKILLNDKIEKCIIWWFDFWFGPNW